MIQAGPVEVMTIDGYRQTMETHFWGPLYAILEVLPGMRRRGEGRIVNIASIGGKISVPHLLSYSASKFTLVGLSEGLRAELAKDGIVGDHRLPGTDAHRQSAQCRLQGTAPGRTRLVQHQRRAAGRVDERRARRPTDHRRLPTGRRRDRAFASGQCRREDSGSRAWVSVARAGLDQPIVAAGRRHWQPVGQRSRQPVGLVAVVADGAQRAGP